MFYYFDLFTVIVFILDYIAHWMTADLRRTYTHRWTAFLLYPITPMGIAGWTTSCGRSDYPAASQLRKVNRKLPYLEFTTGFSGVGAPNDEDWPVILEASNRAQIKRVDGVWRMVIASPKDGNMSPEVFTCLRETVERSNRPIRCRGIRVTKRPVEQLSGEKNRSEKDAGQ
ncbi:hypothetical protein [uncultured Rikenella sp.]|uniref:hypothetical protein n=1 Tax=uncultured Rikenella sp. TaxID=368003 RepID=UPI00262D3382|nr:hypothetical protein [uncultured Rikenella sp.]